MAKQVSEEYEAALNEADEYQEVTGSGGGDFPPVWDFGENDTLVGVFTGTITKSIKGKDRTIHTFDVDGVETQAWGTAILDDRLADVEPGNKVKVNRRPESEKVSTQSGNRAWLYKVFVARSAMNRAA